MTSPTVRLEDARGFWRLFHRAELRWVSPDTCTPRGQVWRLPLFVRDASGVFRAQDPAIGPAGAPLDELYRPAGWSFPELVS